MEKEIARFDKNASEEVRVQLREFRGHQLLDMRVYFRPEDGSEPRPTRKGLSVSVNLAPKLLEAVQAAMGELRAAESKPAGEPEAAAEPQPEGEPEPQADGGDAD